MIVNKTHKKNHLPIKFQKGKFARVTIICEGLEEEMYMQRLKELEVFNSVYIIDLKNAGSIDKIADVFSIERQKTITNPIIFCDTEFNEYEADSLRKFVKLIEDISKDLGINDFDIASKKNNIIFFAGPTTMQIILSHFTKKPFSKNFNAKKSVEKFTGIKDYNKTKHKINQLMSKITKENFEEMIKNIKNLSHDYTQKNCTNFLRLVDYLLSSDTSWLNSND